MSCTIDHLQRDQTFTVLQPFTDARGVQHQAGEAGIIRNMDLDWETNEIWIEWERKGVLEKMHFSLKAATGPRNGKMREYFELQEEVVPATPVTPQKSHKEWARPQSTHSRSTRAPETTVRPSAAKHPESEVCLKERAVACDCDPLLHRPIYPILGEHRVYACLRCGTVTCTRMVGDDGRFTGDSWQAYWTIRVPQNVVDWLGMWPRVKFEYSSARILWPMSADWVIYQYLVYPAHLRITNPSELENLEIQLQAEQAAVPFGRRMIRLVPTQSVPPQGLPEPLHSFLYVWEAARSRPDGDLNKLIHLAHPRNPASPLAAELLLQRPDSSAMMIHALRSDDEVWQGAGHAMVRHSTEPNPNLPDAILDIIESLSLSPLPDVPGRIVSCQRFESLLVLMSNMKDPQSKIRPRLKKLAAKLFRYDRYLVDCIQIVERELENNSQAKD